MLSLNDVPEVHHIFARFPCTPVETSYSISNQSTARGRRAELLITSPNVPLTPP